MFDLITPVYRFTCDRCGRVQGSYDEGTITVHPVWFCDISKTIRKGDVCPDCYNDFCELAENFFDVVNQTEKGGEG